MTNLPPLLESLDLIRSEVDLMAFLRRLAKHFNFAGFLLFNIPAVADETLLPRVELSGLPDGMIEAYDELGLLKNSQIFQMLRRSTIPLTLDTDTVHTSRPSDEAERALQFFARYNITTAAFFPVHDHGGCRAAFGFLGDRTQLSHAELGELGVYAAHAYNIYSSLKNGQVEKEGILSIRELEALHWVANGKTSSEVAAILSLSEHTVNTYINNAIRKLDCVNRIQLVAKAMRLHLIS
ncbi:DNA-binding CsgD family transcriptional regulator [Hoeflea halophila]|uniref:DNA-binding CsgD family transcriptional regulator n=1 Tax=Hoeflea halophila TaxID=714899 RepID=A0A286I5M1_9HYPH|nr:LuxR family transcriptional regulator [Hoeflea halophila]SOE15332.1 DNA-binding CsgD family transcriptional regulator [Hoeflea halophila]